MDFDSAAARAKMVTDQIIGRGITDTAVIQAMQTVPREQFVLDEYREYAYNDTPLPIPANQTISQPYVVGYMLEAMALSSVDKVLEIGTGSGYVAALLEHIVAEVYTVERHEKLVWYARERLLALGCQNVRVHHGDGTLGWPEHGPYEGIIVAAGGPYIPPSLQEQLAVNGRLVIPTGKRGSQNLICLTRTGQDSYQQHNLGPVKFVPLIGRDGWEMGD
ncbi:MAG: protein-L-isoaspartate(D-aspartate) O-methyltransferase [Chloroflexi bacterium]|nr:protein-L-isoaspartate(D-aspartate) O-methyltransferase [Chloroflexota bacterium]